MAGSHCESRCYGRIGCECTSDDGSQATSVGSKVGAMAVGVEEKSRAKNKPKSRGGYECDQ